MVPEGWAKYTVDNLFDVQLGKMLNKAAKERSPQEPYLTNFNVRWGTFGTSKLNSMFFSDKDKEKFSLKAGDLLVCEGGEVGRCAIWEDEVVPCYYQKALHRLRSKGQVVPQYFQSYMEHIAGTKNLDNFTSRTSIAHLTREKFVKLPISLPPLPEQTKIAQVLSTWDKAIASTEQLLSNSQQQKKALMQQLLTGKKRFSGFEGEWRTCPIEEFISLGKKKFESKKAISHYECIELEHIGQGTGSLLGSTHTDKTMSTKSMFDNGDVLFGKLRPYLRKYWIADRAGVCSTEIWVLKAQMKAVLPEYLFQLVQTEHFIDATNISSGTHMPRADWKVVRDIPFKLPEIEEQRKIVSALSSVDREIEILRQELDNLTQEKKALMQQLLTGNRRVKV